VAGRLAALSWALWGLFVEFAAKFALAPAERRYLREY
jgi:hypothetical protein